MSEGKVLSVIPIEETIIDPLYEPLKLNRYELCEHLQRLKDISHLRYGFSPYLLFDVEGMKEVVETIGYLFSIDDPSLKGELNKNTGEVLTRLKNEFKSNGFSLSDDVEKEELRITDKERVYIIREEDEKLNVYRFKSEDKEGINSFFKHYATFLNELTNYLKLLEEYIAWEKDKKTDKTRNDYYKELKYNHEKIIGDKINRTNGTLSKINEEYKKILKNFFYSSNEFEKNFAKISHLFQLAHPIRVSCPTPGGKEQFMCEEGKIYSLKEALLRTFELRRAKWLYMSGSLHTIHRAATHTRLSHQIGSLIVGVNALGASDVYPYDDVIMTLGEYLLMRGDLHEFLMANFLHDIGHSPLSHVLEQNPFIELDHEEITRNLILGEKIERDDDIDWYITERYLLKMKAIKEFEHRFFKNKDDPVYNIDRSEIKQAVGKIRSEGESKGSKTEDIEKDIKSQIKKIKSQVFLENLGKNDEILDSEIVTVSEVLENFGVDRWRIVEIVTGKIFCPHCKKTLVTIKEIESGTKCSSCGKKIKADEVGYEKIYDTQFLNKLIDSEIDLDRIDHVKRDSEICGLSLTSFRLTELLGSISLVLPDSRVHDDVYIDRSSKHNAGIKSPYIVVSQDGISYLMDLLNSRREIYNNIMFSDENNWINGVANQITALAVRYLPHLTNMLPFISDQILAHFFTNELFLGTTIEKLNLLFQGKNDYSSYGEPMRYKLRDDRFITSKNLEEMYTKIEEFNNRDVFKKMRLPAVVFYTNIKPIECPTSGGKTEDEVITDQREKVKTKRSWDNMLVYGKKFTRLPETEERIHTTEIDQKFYKFNELVKEKKYFDTSRDVFPTKPNELDVKDLFFVWIYDFVISADDADPRANIKSKENWEKDIKALIVGILDGKNGGKKSFDEWFVALDVLRGVN